MPSLLRFKAPIVFGLFLNFFSGYGQTFFISVFVPGFMATFALSEAKFGTYYSALTLVSAFILPKSSEFFESLKWRFSGTLLLAALAVSALLLSNADSLWIMVLAIFGLRHFGQGLSSHVSSVVIVKKVTHLRATALSIASLGFPLSEALLPVLAAFMLTTMSWAQTWEKMFFIALGLMPFFFLLGRYLEEYKTKSNDEAEVKAVKLSFIKVIKNRQFLKYLPASICAPFFATGIFLFQTSFSKMKGWDPNTLSIGFTAFALTRLLFSLIGGPIIDKYKATKVYPYLMIPMFLGMLVLGFVSSPIAGWIFMIAMGMTLGASAPLKSALWTELFGPELHGRYRSISASFAVFSTSISPILFGYLIEVGTSPQVILSSAALAVFLSAWLAKD